MDTCKWLSSWLSSTFTYVVLTEQPHGEFSSMFFYCTWSEYRILAFCIVKEAFLRPIKRRHFSLFSEVSHQNALLLPGCWTLLWWWYDKGVQGGWFCGCGLLRSPWVRGLVCLQDHGGLHGHPLQGHVEGGATNRGSPGVWLLLVTRSTGRLQWLSTEDISKDLPKFKIL